MKKLNSQNGFTLIEVIMLIVVLSIVGMTFGGTVLHLVRMSTTSFVTKKATILASNEFEEVFAYKANNSPDQWQNYLNANYNRTQNIDDFIVTTIYSYDPNGYYTGNPAHILQVAVTLPNSGNTLQFSTKFTPRQWD